ncbi:MAG: EthD domain-containing protein [Panacagrimonas sp.]
MLITLGFYKRKPGLSIEDFRRIWCEEYGRLYGQRPEITQYLRRYVQHRLSPQTDWPGTFIGFDGFSEAWFENADARNAMQATPYYQAVLKPMVETFLDMENSKWVAYDDQVYQVGGPPPLFSR